jgi:uncharacterized protein YjbI with pentapeptide repeats
LTGSADLAAGGQYANIEVAGDDLSGTRLEGAAFLSCEFRSVEADVARWRGVSARLTTFRGSRMTGVQLNECQLRETLFVETRLDMANFRMAKLERVTFRDCSLNEADFADAELDTVRFESCRLNGASFRGARCRATDLRGSSLEDLDGAGGLAGATIDAVQLMELAPALARHIGLRVEAR